ncbi:hypothetical protein [Natrinema versiforme]|uniref:DUF8108 domain-containing protein n=1 Tax=Natrinema versiforme JCM 10478 TaxID=1227496 RepID=L9YAJ4_9EURY|nr:hypothetical protein [Natrinema versiforme]ELY71060.1 hypothetical protein C489_01851 [Natrinema versiforme JCM 10478]
MTRPDDVLFRTRIETFALIRRCLPIALFAGALVGPITVTDPTTGVWLSVLGVSLVLIGLHVVSRLPLYPAHTFGIEYRFEEEPFETDRRRCVRCETLVTSGTHRRYAKQLVVLGVPLHTLEWGHNDFCADCIGLAEGVGSSPEADRAAGPDPTPTQSTVPNRERSRGRDRDRNQTQNRNRGPTAPSAATRHVDPSAGRLESARRVDRSDETTALELRRAFE